MTGRQRSTLGVLLCLSLEFPRLLRLAFFEVVVPGSRHRVFRIASMIYDPLTIKGSAVIFVLAEWVEWVLQEAWFTAYKCS